MVIEEIKQIESTKTNIRRFGILVGGVLILVAGLLFWNRNFAGVYGLIAGLGLIGTAAVAPGILKPVYLAWMTLAAVLGWVMTRIILGVLFFSVLTPIGLTLKLFGKQFLDTRRKAARATYWNDLSKEEVNPEGYKHQF
jgi:hypothetical protein